MSALSRLLVHSPQLPIPHLDTELPVSTALTVLGLSMAPLSAEFALLVTIALTRQECHKTCAPLAGIKLVVTWYAQIVPMLMNAI